MAEDLSQIDVVQKLLEPDAEAERTAIDPLELGRSLQRQVDHLLDGIDVAIHQVALDSRIVADLFWEEQAERFQAKEPGILGVRVRINKGTLEVAYFRNAFTRKGDSKRNKAFYAKHIRKSGKYRYAARDFAGAYPWEKALAIEHEDEHAKNRKLFAELSSARRYLRGIKKSLVSGEE